MSFMDLVLCGKYVYVDTFCHFMFQILAIAKMGGDVYTAVFSQGWAVYCNDTGVNLQNAEMH